MQKCKTFQKKSLLFININLDKHKLYNSLFTIIKEVKTIIYKYLFLTKNCMCTGKNFYIFSKYEHLQKFSCKFLVRRQSNWEWSSSSVSWWLACRDCCPGAESHCLLMRESEQTPLDIIYSQSQTMRLWTGQTPDSLWGRVININENIRTKYFKTNIGRGRNQFFSSQLDSELFRPQ